MSTPMPAHPAPRQHAINALHGIAPDHPAVRLWGRLEGSTPEQAAEGNAWAADPEDIVDLILIAVVDALRAETGPAACGCGGCDACAQQALVDWLDPR
ncbi:MULTISPECIES: hypothetical protein [unclassified Streptomyces]|uniref:hypothetical protein n=1 Tax=unclassified Streptomyces TaxID=2593676 RepID=UPI0036EB8B03